MAQVPLSTELSQLFVAFTIEVDEAFESTTPHSATVKNGAGLNGGGPWLVSQVMWSNYLRHVDEAGTPVAVVQERACVSTSVVMSRLNHLRWWGYITLGDVKGTKARDQLVRLTPGGARACAAFGPLRGLVEQRWRERFGGLAVDELRAALAPVVQAAPPGLPRSVPVVDYGAGMRTQVVLPEVLAEHAAYLDDDLSALLARALVRFTIEFEGSSEVSLPHLANVLHVLDTHPVPVKELPLRAGVSKQAIDASMTFLMKTGLVASVGQGAKALASLTNEGGAARTAGRRRLTAVEKSWEQQHGVDGIDRLRAALECILTTGEGPGSLMAKGLVPHDGAWRAHKNYRQQTEAVLASPRDALPHHPMVLHRGGFPDGS